MTTSSPTMATHDNDADRGVQRQEDDKDKDANDKMHQNNIGGSVNSLHMYPRTLYVDVFEV